MAIKQGPKRSILEKTVGKREPLVELVMLGSWLAWRASIIEDLCEANHVTLAEMKSTVTFAASFTDLSTLPNDIVFTWKRILIMKQQSWFDIIII